MIRNGLLKALASLLLMTPGIVNADQYGDFTYSTDGTNVTITNYIGSADVVIIPNTINSQPVTSIGDWAFSSLKMSGIIIPDSVTTIGDAAFYGCVNLASITFPGGVTNIGAGSFNSCSLSDVTIPASVTSIGDYAFFNCTSLTNITVDTANPSYRSADGVLFNKDKSILMQFPSGKTGSYTIPDSVCSIADEAFGMNDAGRYPFPFAACVGLTNLIISGSVTNIRDHAFSHCTGLISVTLSNGIASLGNEAFSWCGNLASITIPDSVGSIGQEAFYYAGLTNAAILGSVTNFGVGAFAVCTNLTSVTISGNTSIGDRGFSCCSSLMSVTLSNGITSLGNEAFSWCGNLNGITFPDSVGSIGQEAFYYTGLTNITIPGSVTNFGAGAFAVCSNLTTVTMDNGVTGIGEAGFNFCTNLTSVAIPESVTSIGPRAFWFCTTLTNVIIPVNVTDIGDYAFSACSSLINITVNADNPSYSSVDGVLFNKDQSVLLQFPGGRGGSYTVPSGVTSIGDYAFGNYDPYGFSTLFPSPLNLTNLIISRGVITIGNEAFYSLSNLAGVYFEGDAPLDPGDLYYDLYFYESNAIIYYRPGTTGWERFAQWPVQMVLWNPQMQSNDRSFGMETNGFGFNITGTTNIPIVLEAAPSPAGPWTMLHNCTLNNGSVYFSDPAWTNYPSRFYRIRSP